MKRLLAASLMLAALSAFAHEPVYNQESIKVLQEHALTNVPGKKTIMLTVDYAPGQATVPHSHTGTAVAYVLEGEITSQRSRRKRVYSAHRESQERPARGCRPDIGPAPRELNFESPPETSRPHF